MTIKKSILRSTLLGVAFGAMAAQSSAAVLLDQSGQDWQVQQENIALNQKHNQLIIKYRPALYSTQSDSPTSTQSLVRQTSNYAGQQVDYVRPMALGRHVVRLSKGMKSDALLKTMTQISSDPNVESVEIDRRMTIQATPNDPQYTNQWHYFESTGGINVEPAWNTTTGAGAVVAVIDTGYVSHSDLQANMLPGYDFITDPSIAVDGDGRDSDPSDPGDHYGTFDCFPLPGPQDSSWHGTHVAGTIAAISNNNKGVAGIAYSAKVVPVRVLGKCGGNLSDIADAIVWSAGGNVPGVPANQNPADVINMSLGGGGSCSSVYQDAINSAVNQGATVVVASGNSNTNASQASPANCNNVISVASTTRAGDKAFYSNFGSVVDVAAPGGETGQGSVSNGVLSTLNSGKTTPASEIYEYYQGTSMAAPHVAGIAALMYSVKPNISPSEVESALKTTTRNFPGTCNQCGTGIVDATAAVAEVSDGSGGGDTELENGVAETNLSGQQASEQFFKIEVPAGASNLSFNLSDGVGDADMYTRFGSKPTTSQYSCRPYLSGNIETCSYATPQAGTWYVMLRGYSQFASVTLVASYDTDGGNNSLSESNLSGSTGEWKDYQLDVPAGASTLNVEMSGGTGDADLYVRFGSNPTTGQYNCRPYNAGNNETCTISSPQAGTWYIRVRAYSNYAGVSLEASSQ